MLRLYISYAPADQPYVDELRKWLKPLEEKYALQVYAPTLADSTQYQYHQFHVAGPSLIYPTHWEEAYDHLTQAHIYLFFISYQALSISYIEQEEVPRAVERFHRLTKNFVRIFPVLVSPSLWKTQSGLAGFKEISGAKTLAEAALREDAFKKMMEELTLVIEELGRNWREEKHRLGEAADDFLRSELPAPARPAIKPMPGWAGVVMVMVLLYLVTSWYFSGCAPKMYYLYTPKELPYQPMPDRFLRDNPVQPPVDVPLRPDQDTLGQRQRLPQE